MFTKIVLSLFFMGSALFGAINDHKDFQFWLFNSNNKDLSSCDTIFVEAEVRFGDDASKLYLGYIQALLRHQINSWLYIVPGYRQLWARASDAVPFRPVYSPLIDGVIKIAGKHLLLLDRNRVQYLIFEHTNNLYVYRNRLYLTTVRGFTSIDAHPFISDEFFFVERLGFEQNRLMVGLGWVPERQLSPQLFFLLRHRKDLVRSWEYQKVLGLQLFISF